MAELLPAHQAVIVLTMHLRRRSAISDRWLAEFPELRDVGDHERAHIHPADGG
jgi:hypothetical protein